MHLEHEHDCGHTHDHPHTHELEHAHDHSHTAAPRDELIALMRYMVGHNVSHTNELKELAHKLAHTGDSEACAQILDAVPAGHTFARRKRFHDDPVCRLLRRISV